MPINPINSNSTITSLELLAPAKNADTGIEAIRHGADAVYIGASAFGARAAAANQLDDIRCLVDFAHLFHAKVYVTVNTIVYDKELPDVEQLIAELYQIGVDALIVQDMAIRKLNIPPIPLHASTQMDNRTPKKVLALSQLGYEQVVLARELSLDEISDIHAYCPDVRLEAFVHGALCVSYSGQCYVSQALFKRSANRGECAQVCRMEFDLENSKGEKILQAKHLLSLKDLCQIDYLEQMAEAGVSSFKIEGRLKDVGYVKNVTAAYSRRLDDLVRKKTGKYRRSSRGLVHLAFHPDVAKSFNRGFTHYFLLGKNDDIFAFDTPKAIGKPVGRIREVFTNHLVVEPDKENLQGLEVLQDNTQDRPAPKGRGSFFAQKSAKITFSNGDGLCCLTPDGKLIGFRVNRAEGERLYPLKMPIGLRRGMRLYRNYDKRFEEILAGDSAERFIPVHITMDYDKQTSEFVLSMSEISVLSGESGFHEPYETPSVRIPFNPEIGRTPQRDNILRQLSKLGNTPLRLESLQINYKENYFIPSSFLSQWRRELTGLFLSETPLRPSTESVSVCPQAENIPMGADTLDSIASNYNIANHISLDFYKSMGVGHLHPAYEIRPSEETPLMTCRHCIRYALGWCYKRQKEAIRSNPLGPQLLTPDQPLFLSLRNGIRLALHFDCSRCLMTVHLDSYSTNK